MKVEMASERVFTSSQLENQRLFGVGPGAEMPELPGDKAKRVQRKLTILVAATIADVGESCISENVLKAIKGHMVDEDRVKAGDLQAIQRSSYFSGIGFVEDMASDELYSMGMNALLRHLTGLDDVTYATPTAKLIGGWTNLASFASGKFQDMVDKNHKVVQKLEFWKKPWNLVNAVNAEAFIGLLEELPIGIGSGVKKIHSTIDRNYKKSELLQFADGVAKALVTGYHIEKNVIHDSRTVVNTE